MDNLTPYFSDDDYESLALHIQDLLDNLEQLPHPKVKEDMLDLLGSIDMMHREALVRMLLLVQRHAPQMMPRLEQDFVISSVLSLYELLAEPSPPSQNVTFIPIDQIGVSPVIKEPIWIPGGQVADLPPGAFRAQKFEDVDILLCNVDDKIFALRNACLDSILPLSSGQLEEHVLICPWHGCRYDVRTGEIQNGSGLKLETFPVSVDEKGRFNVGFNIPKYSVG